MRIRQKQPVVFEKRPLSAVVAINNYARQWHEAKFVTRSTNHTPSLYCAHRVNYTLIISSLDEWNNRQLGNSIGRWKHGRVECKSFKLYCTFKKRKKEMRIVSRETNYVYPKLQGRALRWWFIDRDSLENGCWIGWIWESLRVSIQGTTDGSGTGRDRSCRCDEMLERTQRVTYISTRRIDEKRHQLVMYMKGSICGIGYTCHVLTGCPIKRFGTSSRDPSFFRSPDTVATPFISRIWIYPKNKGVAVCIQL